MRVLVWHERVQIVTQWQTAFGRLGHYVRRARSDEEAAALLRGEKFDIFIFDLIVGEQCGLAVALLAEFHQPEINTILVTSSRSNNPDELFARLSNLRAVLSENTSADDLVAYAEAHMSRAVPCERARSYPHAHSSQLAHAAEEPAPYFPRGDSAI